jgi:hypothetical protein
MPRLIGDFLSDGGELAYLEDILEVWVPPFLRRPITVIETELTGDKTPEVIVLAQHTTPGSDGFTWGGDIAIYSCADGRYEMEYLKQAAFDGDQAGILQIEDINGDALPEVVYVWGFCGVSLCSSNVQAVAWSASDAQFVPLVEGDTGMFQSTVAVEDIDGDGPQEIIVETSGLFSSISIGPRRGMRDIYAWNGRSYTLHGQRLMPSNYLIHTVNDADEALARGEISQSLDLYLRARTDPELLVWPLAYPDSEKYQRDALSAYVTFKRVIGFALKDQDDQALLELARLRANSPAETSTGYGFLRMAELFWQAFQETDSPEAGCRADVDYAGQHPEAYEILNAYGPVNPFYTPGRLCPY